MLVLFWLRTILNLPIIRPIFRIILFGAVVLIVAYIAFTYGQTTALQGVGIYENYVY
ncbi:MAG: hypothetical protein FWB72_01045 [Firmicutes bacterium]|nr:hypothetical protein [Bacillota bacterium]